VKAVRWQQHSHTFQYILCIHTPENVDTLPICVLLYSAEPDLEFEGLLKRQHTRVKYFQGSLMNAMDLERTKVIYKVSEWQLTAEHFFRYYNPTSTRVLTTT
jgi:hypothetical protein